MPDPVVHARPVPGPSPQRAGLHHLLDRVLDARPDLEAGVVGLLKAVEEKLNQPGVMATTRLFAAGQRLFRELDNGPATPVPPDTHRGFRAR